MLPDKDELNPYVGPRAFEKEDKELFFGRDREAEELVSMIFGHPIVLVYAESGAGKTSLLNAQVVPTLEEKGFQVLPVARVKGEPPEVVNPKDIGNLYAFNVLRSMSHTDINQPTLLSETLPNFLKKYPRKLDKRQKPSFRTLIIDQFEELFTIFIEGWNEQRRDFIQQISNAVKEDLMLRIVLVIREDYLAQLDPFIPLLPERLRPRFRLVRLNAEAAKLAITGPLKTTRRSYANGVVEKLVEQLLKIQVEIDPISSSGLLLSQGSHRTNEITGEYVEPVQLQVVCERLWQKLPPKVIVITKDYLGNVDNALADFYVKIIRDTSAEAGIKESSLRDWCETKLITSSGTRSIIHRDAETTGGLSNKAVGILENRRLIRAEQRLGAKWYELTHDRLIGPIRESNRTWKYEREHEKYERERKKKLLIIKVTVPVIAAIIIGSLAISAYYYSNIVGPI